MTMKQNQPSSIHIPTFIQKNGSYTYMPAPLMPRESINTTDPSKLPSEVALFF